MKKIKYIKRIITALACVMMLVTSARAEGEVETTVASDVVNQYIWRGQNLGDVSLQPTLGLSYKGLSLTSWGSVGLSDNTDTKEFDLTAAYSFAGFNVGITDYWFNTPNDRYFSYSAHQTSHVFEANLGYNFGPLALQWYTNFAGNDGLNKNGKRAYSSYVEVSAPFNFAGCDWVGAVGAVPYATSFYSEVGGFAVTNISLKATKDIKITDKFSVPIFAGVCCNPSNQKAYLMFGLTLRP
jgi:hypothetical protein